MNLNKLAQDVHALTLKKGFLSDTELIAAIHAEISEAFEQWKAGQPMVYHMCAVNTVLPCEPTHCEFENLCDPTGLSPGPEYSTARKPEGIAVKLIDVVLRVLDAAAAWHVELGPVTTGLQTIREMDLPTLVAVLHFEISHLLDPRFQIRNEIAFGRMTVVISFIETWLCAQGVDPNHLISEEYEYNKGSAESSSL